MKQRNGRQMALDERRTAGLQRILGRWSFVVGLLLCLLPAGALAQSAEEALVIPAGQTYTGNLATFTRDIRVEGDVTGDVTSWSGAIEIVGRVGGDVVSYSGPVTVHDRAQIGGSVLASSGTVPPSGTPNLTGQAIVGGGGRAVSSLIDLFVTFEAGGTADVGRVLFGVALGVFLLAFMLLGVAFWPRRTAAASQMLQRTPGHALLLGLLTTLLLALALPPMLALLAATVIGLPLIVVLLAVAHVPYIYGLAVLTQARGALRSQVPAIAGEFPLTRATAITAALLALPIALSAALVPLWGLGLFYFLASPGLGAILLSRGGLFAPA
jgi:hypothetical protein